MRTFRFRDYRLPTKLSICLALIVAVALAASAWIYHQRNLLADADRWTEHTYQALAEIGNVLENVLELQAGLRGYVISRSSTSLETYQRGRKEIEESIGRLKQLTADNPEQQRRLSNMESAIKIYIEQTTDPIIGMMSDETTHQRAVDMINDAIRKRYYSGIRQQAAAIESAERDLLKARERTKAQARDQITWAIIAGAAAMTLVSIAAGALLARSIARPLGRMTAAMQSLAEGKLDTEVPSLDRRDEIGELSSAFVAFKASLSEAAAMRSEQAQQEQRQREQRKSEMARLADSFEASIGNIVKSVSSASTELEGAAGTLTRTADHTQNLASNVAGASEEASANVQSVASAAEEMTAAINEIGRQTQESQKLTARAVEQANRTDVRMGELTQAAASIGDVVKLITHIADQTNLLALNATIEAARAGEAGRGFAIVASEVKSLAAQTAKATGEIGTQIADIQTATRDSVAAITEIGATINALSQVAASIALAVDEQDVVTREIGRSVQQAALGTTEVASNITEVSRGATETGSACNQVFASAKALAEQNGRLTLEVDEFLRSVRAA